MKKKERPKFVQLLMIFPKKDKLNFAKNAN